MSIPSRGKLIDRIGITIELTWEFNMSNCLTLRRWFYYGEAEYCTKYQGKECIWIRGYVRLLGFVLGAGIYYAKKSS